MHSSSNKRYGAILPVSTIQGAGVALILWMIGNQWKVNGAGWPERLGWPWSNVYLVVLGGAVVGAFAGLVRARFAMVQSEGVEEAARSMGLGFQPDVARTELREIGEFSFFEQWRSGSNRVTGQLEGLPVEMLDCAFVEKHDEGDRQYAQTIVFLPARDGLPVFELRPKKGWLRVLEAVGMPGITFDLAQTPPEDARSVQEFCARYFLSRGIDAEVTENADSLADGESKSDAERYDPIRRLFSTELLRYFAANPSWCVDSNGKHVAIWRANTLIPGRDRQTFLTTAVEVRQAIVRSAESKTGAIVPACPGVREIAAIQARFLGAVLGMFAGIIAGVILTGLLPSSLALLTPVVFFGTPVLGPVVGWFLGGLALTPAIAALNRRKQTRQAQALAASPWRQPLESTAVVDEEADRLTIRFPAGGLIRGGGCALVAGCVMATLFMTVFSAVWVPAALLGEVNWIENEAPPNPGQLPVKMSPWAALLFLVPFWLVLLAAITTLAYRARRRAILQVDGSGLRIEEFTLFGARQQNWQHDEVADIQAAADFSHKGPRNPHLAIVTRKGETFFWLGWRNRTEVKWLAELVRRRMGFANDSETPSPA